MHKNTRLLPYMRKAAYEEWKNGKSVSFLAREYKVTRKIVYRVLERARMGEFENRKSVNARFRTIEYGLRRLSATERKLEKKIARQWIRRYEKERPGEMVHFDTKRLPLIYGEGIRDRREHLHVAIDDYSRYLVADIFPGKSQYSGAMHLEEVIETAPFAIEDAYSDNGSTYKGRKDHVFIEKCAENHISKHFTKTRHPQTNGKAERVIQTLMREWCRPRRFSNHEERRQSLQEYVHFYNFERKHSGIGNKTPIQRITDHIAGSVYNA
ncbi:MAG: transposase family protein [Candidatus Moranbacteria bacterium]|nr:transposase family protein [Candidatus Moranbacteria bacterium]